ncbi:hypothetical protein JCM6882_004013 [Rhodosporidiobolus microsporus]
MSSLTSAVGPATCPTEILYLVARHFLSQALELLREVVVTDELLSRTSELSKGASVGKHLRHLADHYKALFDALEAAQSPADEPSPSSSSSTPPPPTLPPLHLNYDNRSRNVSAEHSHSAAVSQFEDLQRRLARLTDEGKGGGGAAAPEREVRLEAVTPVKVEVRSTFARELWFASFHAVHHFALIRVIVCGELHLTVPEDFGVAPSTLKHREDSEAAVSSPPKL